MSNRPGDWHVLLAHPGEGKYTLACDMGASVAVYSMQIDTSPLFDLNNSDENDSTGKRFGDGQVVARFPDHLLYSPELKEVGKAMDEGDRKHLRKVLNDPDFRKLRSFRGRL